MTDLEIDLRMTWAAWVGPFDRTFKTMLRKHRKMSGVIDPNATEPIPIYEFVYNPDDNNYSCEGFIFEIPYHPLREMA